ncbi:MAG: Coenzyme F420 hydrogenase/dehydrogenase, beta subunit C-terminal domain [Victivallales bacterium]|nr:Coenzyme F420 hydrogenase/dehydrogenase, beta subunit C-terminal domain [Victivallales bacterium]
MNEQNSNRFEKPEVYAAKHKDDFERMASQSGGMFAVISDVILSQGGIIYGCAFDDSFQVIHIRGDNADQRNRMRYSKYVQSRIGDVYKNVLADLKMGRNVLFSGTSCQVAGVLSFIKMSSDKLVGKLFTVDIVCHGVPSPLVWRDFLAWESNKKKTKIKGVICRNKKKFGWKSSITTIQFDNGKTVDSRVYPKFFYSHVALRPSCFKCPYKSILHPSDITIGDYWGIEKAVPGFKDEKGVSLVLINTSQGKDLFDFCKDKIDSVQTTVVQCMQKALIEPYNPPENRVQFWKDYRINSFDDIAKKYGNYTFMKVIRWKIKYFLKRIGLIKD